MTSLRVEGLHVSHGERSTLAGIELEVAPGTVTALLGASGSGKTTLLRAIAGLERPERGAILIDGVDVTAFGPDRRDVGMVFQQAPLDPTRDVRANLRFPLSIRGITGSDAERRIRAEARAFSIGGLLERLPRQLSEGQRHAAAAARGLVRAPAILLLDEPLADLDPPSRARAVHEIATVQRGYGVTMVIATNDQQVAAALADRVAVLDAGRIVQVGTYGELLASPADVRVGTLIGEPPMRLLTASVVRRGERTWLEAPGVRRPTGDRRLAPYLGDPVTVGIRPEHLRRAVTTADTHVRGLVAIVGLLGPDGLVDVALPDGQTLTARLPRPLPERDDTIELSLARATVFDLDGRVVATVR